MIIFLDENDAEYGALATIKATNAVNGERSITGEIISGDVVLSRIERGWRLRFEDEYYVVTYAKPIDEGKNVQVSFDAVHQFFWDFGKSSVYDQLSDGSHTFRAYLDFIFKNSGYSYTVDTALNVYAFEKQSFGLKKRLTLFNDIITSTGVEFQVNGKVVRILAKVGTDLSTVVRKNFNLNELGIEKNIGDFVTYQKGYGAYFDEEDHSKGRLEVEYISPLASVYGKLEAEPFVDERYSQSGSLLAVLKANVDNSYTISVSLDMEDLTRAGYKYKQPVAGDYIMAINETLGFKEKIRIVSFTSEYDVAGQLIKHTVTCNDIGSVKKLSASYTQTQHQAANAEENANTAYEFANKALVSANGKNTNYYGDTFPVDNPKGTLKKGDLLFLTVGDTVKQYYWNGAEWATNPVVSDVEAFKEQIAEDLKDVPNREEFENKISEEIANSKAEIETKIETAKTQAESNAKEYADEINQITAGVAELANAAAGEIKADLVNVKSNLTSTSIVANNAQAAVDTAKQDLANVTSELNTAKQDLTSHAQQLQTQANAQTELTKRVTTVETTANGTKTTVSELSKTVDGNMKNITSVTARTKVVEDDLTSTKTTLSQVQTTADGASSKAATLETGLNGLSAKFETLKIGSRNYFKNSKSRKYYIDNTEIQDVRTFIDDEFWENDTRFTKDYVRMSFDIAFNPALPSDFTTNVHFSASPWYNCGGITFKGGTTALQHFDLKFNLSGADNSYKTDNVFIRLHNTLPLNTAVSLENFNLYLSAVVEDYTQNEADIESKVAEYKQTADQNYASLQSNLQTLDGTVKQNKSEFDQTASQIKSSISAVEGKIPTSVGGRNYLRGTSDKYQTYTSTNYILGYPSTYRDWPKLLDPLRGKTVTLRAYIKNDTNFPVRIQLWANIGGIYGNSIPAHSEGWSVGTGKLSSDWTGANVAFTQTGNGTNNGGTIQAKEVKLEIGNIPTDWSAAPEDYDNAITQVKSEIKQTADGMTLLATKTELNSAKNALQSSITTHTSQISALNTGLQAKVSQSDFNTLSGRVTTAENNIIAKANELSSKISSVEGKIPANLDSLNLMTGTRDWSTKTNAWHMGANWSTESEEYQGLKVHSTQKGWNGSHQNIFVKNGDVITFSFFAKATNTLSKIKVSSRWADSSVYQGPLAGVKESDEQITITSEWKRYSKTIHITSDGSLQFRTEYDGGTIPNGNTFYVAGLKLAKSELDTGYSENPTDAASDISAISSELKQTTDSIKASVQSLDNSTVKNSSLTINTDGVVIKAGKSTSDFANAVGSYFSVNQNAINLFSDKINVKGNMIVSGAITSDKIASKQINTAHLNGKIITADVISSNAVTADAIKAGAVTTDKMSANSINGDRIAAGTLDAAKIKAGSITASQIASGTITSAQIKTGTISAANIAAGAITSDKIAANSIDASKIAANAITANMIKGGQLRSTNGATVFDLNAGTLTFNNNYGYIQRIASDKIFEITTLLGTTSGSRDYLTSAFNIRKSDNSRRAGIKFTLYNTLNDKPTAEANINADALVLYDSQYTRLFEVWGKSTYMSNFNFRDWGDIPVAQIHGGFIAQDVGLRGHTESLKTIVERLCKKAGVMWL